MSGKIGIASRNARVHLNQTQHRLSERLQNISTGNRINKAADDPAGMSISMSMDADNVLMKQAIRNANDGMGVIQRAEGTLEVMQDMVGRMRTLTVHAASDTATDSDKIILDQEYQELIGEIQRIAKNSNYNGKNLLNGGSDFHIQLGIDDSDGLNIDLSQLAATLGALGLSVPVQSMLDGSGNFQSGTMDALKVAENKISQRRSYLGALQNRMENIVSDAFTKNSNLETTSSSIVSADYASDTSAMTRDLVLKDAGVAAVGQARSISQSVIQILT